jgi:hypothetical protein
MKLSFLKSTFTCQFGSNGSAYKEQRSIRDIMKAFSMPSTTTVYKILTDNNVPFQVYKKAQEDGL